VIDQSGTVSFIDHMIDESVFTAGAPRVSRGLATGAPRVTRAQQRESTRRALIDATVACLTEEGYAALSTRRVADRAGVAQSTLMHHFETRDALLVEAVSDLALRLAGQALAEINLAALQLPAQRTAVLDQAWRKFTSPEGLAAAQLWIAAWSEPELASSLHDLERRIDAIVAATASTLFPEEAADPRFPALIAMTVSVIQGLVTQIPVSGPRTVNARWRAIKPILAEAAGRLLD
jgi:AcrR family transcriptional regulator